MPYDNFEVCKNEMISGIDALKHNYSNNQIKTVRIWFSKDLKTMYYRSYEPGMLTCFDRTRSINLKTLPGYLYGAQTSTFMRSQKLVLGAMNFINGVNIDFNSVNLKPRRSRTPVIEKNTKPIKSRNGKMSKLKSRTGFSMKNDYFYSW